MALTREADLRYATMAAQIAFAKNHINDMAIVIGSILAPTMVGLLKKLTPVILAISDFADRHPWAIKASALLAVAVLALGVTLLGVAVIAKAASFALAGLSAALTVVRFGVYLWRNALLATRASLFLLNVQTAAMRALQFAGAVATGVITAAQWAWNVAMVANPIGIIVVAIGALIAALAAGAYFIHEWTGSWELAAAAVLLPISPLIALGLVIYNFRDNILGAFNAVLAWFKDNWKYILAALALLLGPAGVLIAGGVLAWKFRDAIIRCLWCCIGQWEYIVAAHCCWPTVQGAILWPFLAALGWIADFWPTVKDAILWPFLAALGWIADFWPTVKDAILWPFLAALGWIADFWPTVKDAILWPFLAAWGWITDTWSMVASKMYGPLLDAFDFITGLDLFDAGVGFLQSFLDGVLSLKDKVVEGVKGVLGKVRDFLPWSDAKEGPLSDLTASGKAFLIDTFARGMQQAGDIGLPLADALLPVGPMPQQAVAGAGGDRRYEINIEKIEIIADGGDPTTISTGLTSELGRLFRQVAEESDSQIQA